MKEFLHGWRRKIGTVTLLMALAFTGAWLRGHRLTDVYSPGGTRTIIDSWTSSRDGIEWLRLKRPQPMTPNRSGWRTHAAGTTGSSVAGFIRSHEQTIDWRWGWLGFNFGESHASKPLAVRMQFLTIPYWSLVLPLTLLSAYLILLPPRKRV